MNEQPNRSNKVFDHTKEGLVESAGMTMEEHTELLKKMNRITGECNIKSEVCERFANELTPKELALALLTTTQSPEMSIPDGDMKVQAHVINADTGETMDFEGVESLQAFLKQLKRN